MESFNEKTPLLAGGSSAVTISPASSTSDIHVDFNNTDIKKDEDREQSSFISIFSVWNMMMGTSLLTVPWAIQQCGLLFSILIFLFMFCLAVYTGSIVLKGSSKLATDPGTGLMPEFLVSCRDVIGPWTTWMNFGGNFIVMGGALIVYWILICDLSYNSINDIYDFMTHQPLNGSEWPTTTNESLVAGPVVVGVCDVAKGNHTTAPLLSLWTKKYVFPFMLLPVFLPMMQLKKVTAFSRISTFGTVSLFALFAFIFAKCAAWGLNVEFHDTASPSYVPQYRYTFPTLSGVAAMAFFIHNSVTTIFKHNKNQKLIVRDLTLGFLLALMSYGIVGLGIFLTFPGPKSCIKQNFLDNMPWDDMFSLIVQLLYGLRLMTVFPIVSYVLRVQIFTVLYSTDYPGRVPAFIYSVLAVIPCVLLAMFFPNVGDILRYSGSICALMLMFVLPCVFFVQVKRRFNETWKPYLVIAVLICLVGFANFVGQFVIPPS